MTETHPDRDHDQKTDADELAQAGGVGIGAGEPSTFEPEEDPESVDEGPTVS